MLEIGLRDGLLGLDGMHEAQPRLRQETGDKAHFGDRRDIIMGDARRPERLEKLRRRIGLDRIERPPRKLLDEVPSGAGRGLRTNKRYRSCRFEGKSYPQRAMMLVQFKGPPVSSAKEAALRWKSHGAARRRYMTWVPPCKVLGKK